MGWRTRCTGPSSAMAVHAASERKAVRIARGGSPRWWPLVPAVALLAIALAMPGLLAGPNRIWLRFSLLLGKIVSPIA